MQTTRRFSVLVTSFERYDPNKAFAKKIWVPATWEKIFRDQQSQRSNLPKLSFWTGFDWTGLIFVLKTQKTPLDHVLDSKMQTKRHVGVLVAVFKRYDPNKAFAKEFWVPVSWEKIFRGQQSQRGNLSMFFNNLFRKNDGITNCPVPQNILHTLGPPRRTRE